MTRTFDLAVVGAGPAGMAAAIAAKALGMNVLLIDEQAAPGGQIWRGVESVAATSDGAQLGADYAAGAVSRLDSAGSVDGRRRADPPQDGGPGAGEAGVDRRLRAAATALRRPA